MTTDHDVLMRLEAATPGIELHRRECCADRLELWRRVCTMDGKLTALIAAGLLSLVLQGIQMWRVVAPIKPAAAATLSQER